MSVPRKHIVTVAVVGAIIVGVALFNRWAIDKSCLVETVVEVVSPNGKKRITQEVRFCDDNTEEHAVYVGPRYAGMDGTYQGYPYLTRSDSVNRDVSYVPRLRIWWTDDANVQVEYPSSVDLVDSIELDGVNVQAKPIR